MIPYQSISNYYLNDIKLYSTISNYFQLFLAISSYFQLFLAISSYFQPFPAIFNYNVYSTISSFIEISFIKFYRKILIRYPIIPNHDPHVARPILELVPVQFQKQVTFETDNWRASHYRIQIVINLYHQKRFVSEQTTSKNATTPATRHLVCANSKRCIWQYFKQLKTTAIAHCKYFC